MTFGLCLKAYYIGKINMVFMKWKKKTEKLLGFGFLFNSKP